MAKEPLVHKELVVFLFHLGRNADHHRVTLVVV